MSEPYISVIIPAYNRIQYVKEAINSVLFQTLDRNKYEVIVVTNIDLPEIDRIRIIKTNEKWQGAMVSQAIEEARGEVISLLDDDDLFLPNKLEVVYTVFHNYQVSFLKNPTINIAEKSGKVWVSPSPKQPVISPPIDEAIRKYGADSNSSSMSFRKRDLIEYLSYLKQIKLAVDNFIGAIFLFRKTAMIWDKPLSIYRILMSSATRNLRSLEDFIRHGKEHTKIILEDYETILRALEGNKMFERYVNYQKIIAKFFGNDIKVGIKEVLNATPHYSSVSRLEILGTYLSSFLPFSIRRAIYNKIYERQLKRYG